MAAQTQGSRTCRVPETPSVTAAWTGELGQGQGRFLSHLLCAHASRSFELGKRLQAERAPQVRSPTQERWEVYIPLRDSCAKSSRNRLDRPTHLQCHKTMPRFRRARGAPARRGDTACGVHSWGGLPPVPRVPPTSIIRTLPKGSSRLHALLCSSCGFLSLTLAPQAPPLRHTAPYCPPFQAGAPPEDAAPARPSSLPCSCCAPLGRLTIKLS